MPRIKQYAERYAREAFQKEIRRKQGERDLMSVRALARETEIPATTLGPKLEDPDKLKVEDLKKLVAALTPDPAAVLGLLGYDGKVIRSFLGRQEETA